MATERMELDQLEQAAQTSLMELTTMAVLANSNITNGDWYMFGDAILREAKRLNDLLTPIENRRWDAHKFQQAAA